MQVEVRDFPGAQLARLAHHGPFAQLDETVATFIGWRRRTGLSPIATHATYGIVVNDPDRVGPGEFRFDICAQVDGPVPPNPEGVTDTRLEAGRCAVLRHRGPHDDLGQAVHGLCTHWLASSGHRRRDHPLFLQYVTVGPGLTPSDWITDIFLPLE